MTWSQATEAIDKVLSRENVPIDTVANAQDLIVHLRFAHEPPREVGPGYWPTLCLSWDVEPKGFQIEVFSDRYEFYRFFEGKTEIAELPHRAGDLLSAEIPKALSVIPRSDPG